MREGEVFVTTGGSRIIYQRGVYTLEGYVMRYTRVCNINNLYFEDGSQLEPRIGNDLLLVQSKPLEVIQNYIKFRKVGFEEVNDGRSYYDPKNDIIHVNRNYKREEDYYTTCFHEMAHSTGHAKRLRRDTLMKDVERDLQDYSIEECIAEMTAALLANETGISTFVTSGTQRVDNSAVYYRTWMERIKSYGSKFPMICRESENAFLYIMGTGRDAQWKDETFLYY